MIEFALPNQRKLSAILSSLGLLGLLAAHVVSVTQCRADEFRVIHQFTNTTGDTGYVDGGVVKHGQYLYGIGEYDVFRIGLDGSQYQPIFKSSFGGEMGIAGASRLLQIGPTFYGTWYFGGPYSGGVLFSMGTDGSGYRRLHDFGLLGDSWGPESTPLLVGSKLYGTTLWPVYKDPSRKGGAIYSINLDGTGYSIVHGFGDADPKDGQIPDGALTSDGSFLYGTTRSGGGGNNGTVYRMRADGSDYSILHNFGTVPNEGVGSACELLLIGSTLYGTTNNGGTPGRSSLFKMNTDGSDFTVLHIFGDGDDGYEPMNGALLRVGDMLYGTTIAGGAFDQGTVYRIGIDATNYSIVHSFDGSDGSNPYASLFLDGSVIYGTASYGGIAEHGTIFAITIPEPIAIPTFAISLLLLTRSRRA